MLPRITIIIPCHDGATLLPATLRAALGQTLAEIEVIVVDDASTDATFDVARAVAAQGERVRVVRREQSNGDPAAARACGALAARTPLLWFLDADDVPRAEVAARAVEHLERHPQVGSLALGHELIDERGDLANRSDGFGPWWVPTRFGVRRARPDEREVSLLAVLDSACLISSVLCCRRATYEQAGGWIDYGMRGYEDQDLALRLALAAPMHRLPEAVVGYRVHAGQYTAANADELERSRTVFLDRWRNAPHVAPTSRARLERAFLQLDRRVLPRQAISAAARCVRAGRPVAGARHLGGAARIWIGTISARRRRTS